MTGKNNQRAATKKHAQNAKKREISGDCAFDSEGIAGEEKEVRIEVGIIEEYSVLDCAARLRDVLSRK